MISLAASITITGWSKRTIWRRLSDGTLLKAGDSLDEKTKIELDSLRPFACVPLDDAEWEIIKRADAGCAADQTDVAVIFLSNGQFKSAAYWLELAAKQNFPSAMYLLGHYYVDGPSASSNEDMGIMWIAKAASLGHCLAREVMQIMRSRLLDHRV